MIFEKVRITEFSVTTGHLELEVGSLAVRAFASRAGRRSGKYVYAIEMTAVEIN